MERLPPIRLVLLRPRNPENLGAVARAMKNFGVSDWAIVDPRTLDFASARRVAVHAQEVLDRPRLVASLDEAVADCAWVVATGSRRMRGKRRLSPREVAKEVLARAPAGRTALVFGDERSGMTREEIDRCDVLSAIPTEPEQPSLNLAQALLLYCYEIREAAREASGAPAGPLPQAATDAALIGVRDTLSTLLSACGFSTGGGRHAVRDLFATLRRARLSRREAGLWNAALRSCAKRLGAKAEAEPERP